MSQQKQTLKYFNQNAKNWEEKAGSNRFSVIDNRHKAVLSVIKEYKETGRLLDVGCGTGQLAIEAAKNGWKSIGIDYAASMIEISRLHNEKNGDIAEFYCTSIFDFTIPKAEYTVVSALGFIEYISLDELDYFLSVVSEGLKSNGALALGSRNRLFNLHSLNEFSSLELQLKTVNWLFNESVILQSSSTQQEAINKLAGLKYQYPHPDLHPETDIKVDRRYQYSPADLIARLTRHGLMPTRIFPVHFHGFPLSFIKKNNLSILHLELAEMISNQYINSHEVVPFCSSFVIEAKKI